MAPGGGSFGVPSDAFSYSGWLLMSITTARPLASFLSLVPPSFIGVGLFGSFGIIGAVGAAKAVVIGVGIVVVGIGVGVGPGVGLPIPTVVLSCFNFLATNFITSSRGSTGALGAAPFLGIFSTFTFLLPTGGDAF